MGEWSTITIHHHPSNPHSLRLAPVRNCLWTRFPTRTSSGWWFGTFFAFSHILGISSSQLTFIFFKGVAQPPTREHLYLLGPTSVQCRSGLLLWENLRRFVARQAVCFSQLGSMIRWRYLYTMDVKQNLNRYIYILYTHVYIMISCVYTILHIEILYYICIIFYPTCTYETTRITPSLVFAWFVVVRRPGGTLLLGTLWGMRSMCTDLSHGKSRHNSTWKFLNGKTWESGMEIQLGGFQWDNHGTNHL